VQRVLLAVWTMTGLALFGGDVVVWLQSAFASDARPDDLRAAATARWAFTTGVCIAVSLVIELWPTLARAGEGGSHPSPR
jgi:hypothetical protein